jgi:hypothetical protein
MEKTDKMSGHVSRRWLTRLAACAAFLPLLLGADECNKPIVRVWADVNGGGSARNIDMARTLDDFRLDRYDAVIPPNEFLDDNISAVANFSDDWAMFGADRKNCFPCVAQWVTCFPPHRYIPDLTHIDTLSWDCGTADVITVCAFRPAQGSVNDTFGSYLGRFSGNEDEAMKHCQSIVRGGAVIPKDAPQQ